MTEKEKLEFFVANKGSCEGRKFKCADCPLIDMCCNAATDKEFLETAKERLAKLSKQTSVDPFVEGYKAHQQKLKDIGYTTEFKRDDKVMADGKKWRVDYVGIGYLGLSSDDGSHKELGFDVCHKIDHTFDGIVTP